MTLVVPTGKLEPEFADPDTEGVLQLSVAVGLVHCAMADDDAVVTDTSAGQFVNTGAIVSLEQAVITCLTVTVNEQTPVLPFASVAV